MRRIIVNFFLGLILFISTDVVAQEVRTPSTRRVYASADFDRFAPRSALDMARQIPGFVIQEGGDDRGFGQADTNVLINGLRISGKSNGPVEALGRIPAGDVVRLEVVDGASLGIGGLSGQVLNVVTSSRGGVNGRFRYSPSYQLEETPFSWGDVEVSASGGGSQSEWTVSFRNLQERFSDTGPEFVFDGSGQLVGFRQERRYEYFDYPGLSGSFTRTAENGSVLNLTGETNILVLRFGEVSKRDAGPDVDRIRVLREVEDEFNFEVGADYEFSVLGGRLKLIGLYGFEESPTVDSVRFDFADDSPAEGSVFTQTATEVEAILRTEYVFGALNGDWQWSLEGARNLLDIEAELEQRDANGALQPVTFPGSSSRVEEDRAETTLSYGRSLSPRLQLQSSLGIEYSQISQTGEFGLVRDFVRPKGFVSLNWRPLDGLNISTKLERVVGQLSFFDFIASVNVNQERIDVTNANLVPPQSWLLEVELQQSLGGFGTATLSGFAEDVTDIVDQIPIEGGGQAAGNIDSATRYGASINLTLLSDPLGWSGARIDLSIDYNDSEVLDPLLGTPRRISDQDYFDVEATFRQDFPNTDWAAGIMLTHEEDSPLVRLDEISTFQQSFPFAEVFIENKNVLGLTVRASVGNALDRDNDFFRTIFNDRLSNDIAFQEERFRNFGTIFTLDIEGSF